MSFFKPSLPLNFNLFVLRVEIATDKGLQSGQMIMLFDLQSFETLSWSGTDELLSLHECKFLSLLTHALAVENSSNAIRTKSSLHLPADVESYPLHGEVLSLAIRVG